MPFLAACWGPHAAFSPQPEPFAGVQDHGTVPEGLCFLLSLQDQAGAFSQNSLGKLAHTLLIQEQFISKVVFLRKKKQLLQPLNEGKGRPYLEAIAASWGPTAFAASSRLTTEYSCQFGSL